MSALLEQLFGQSIDSQQQNLVHAFVPLESDVVNLALEPSCLQHALISAKHHLLLILSSLTVTC